MAINLDLLKKITKVTVGTAGVAALPISTIALMKQPETSQMDAPQVDQPNDNGVLEKIKKLEDKVENLEYDVEFNQNQIGRNRSVILDVDHKSKKEKEEIRKLASQVRGLLDAWKEREKKILELIKHIEQFEHYGELAGFVNHMNEMVKMHNGMEDRLVRIEDKFK